MSIEVTLPLILLALPTLLIIARVAAKHIAMHTETKIDDEVAESIGEVLKDLGKAPPEDGSGTPP